MQEKSEAAESAMVLLLPGPDGEPCRMRLYVQPFEPLWVAMLVGADEPAPPIGALRGVHFFGRTPEAAKAAALRFLSVGGHALA